MGDNNENLRRSSRLRVQTNYNEYEVQTHSRNTRGSGRRGRSRKNSNTDDSLTGTPTKTPRDGRVTRSYRRTKSVSNVDQMENESIVMEELEEELEEIEMETQKPSELFEDEDISGNRIYGFQTPAKKNGMAQKALLSCTPSTSKSISTVKTRTLHVLIEKVDTTPSKLTTRLRKSVRIQEPPKTRKRHSRFLSESESESVSEDSEFVPSNTDSETENEEESDIENENNINSTPKKSNRISQLRKVQIPITPCRRGRSKNNIAYRDYHLKTDEYFESQAEKVLTSNHTLGQLKNPRLNEEKLQELLRSENHISSSHKHGICALTKNCKSMFTMWYHIMEEGYSLLLHGLGSKKNLIEDFYKEIISDYPTLVINGFFPSLTIKDILDGIITELLELDTPTNLNGCFDMIEDVLRKNPDDRLYLLIHNIEGAMLRTNKAQDMLSRLAAISNIRVLASVDHINAPLLWDNVKRSRYNFYWWDATTLLPYKAETSYESSLLVQRSGALALSSLHNVFASLTTNAKAIYKILVEYQLENGKNNVYSGMAFKDLYRSAREVFLVSSDIALRAQLTEFIDHKLVRTKRNVDGVEYLNIPLDNSLLQKFLDQETA